MDLNEFIPGIPGTCLERRREKGMRWVQRGGYLMQIKCVTNILMNLIYLNGKNITILFQVIRSIFWSRIWLSNAFFLNRVLSRIKRNGNGVIALKCYTIYSPSAHAWKTFFFLIRVGNEY